MRKAIAIIPKGQEPANIKKRLDTLFPKLNEAYPDKVIVSLQRDHKQWDKTAREISKQLGYANKNDFLTAYGYKIEKLEAVVLPETIWLSLMNLKNDIQLVHRFKRFQIWPKQTQT